MNKKMMNNNFKIEVTEEALEHMKNHARETYPEECCGFLFGTDQPKRIIDEAKSVDNNKEGDKRRRFEIRAEDYLEAERHASSTDKVLLGIYHSHPDHPAKPSEHDLKQAMPFFSYIILSVKEGNIARITSWQLNEEGNFEEEAIHSKNEVSNQ